MKKIELNVPCISTDGEPMLLADRTGRIIPGSVKTLASQLADLLGTETEGKTLKLYGWYKKLQVEGFLELDEADEIDLKALLEKTNRLPIFVKGQIMEIISK